MTGIYDLVAVLTHKGRSADSGHYVGWVKQENGWFWETELCLQYLTLSRSLSSNNINFCCWQGNGQSLMMTIPNQNQKKTSLDYLEEVRIYNRISLPTSISLLLLLPLPCYPLPSAFSPIEPSMIANLHMHILNFFSSFVKDQPIYYIRKSQVHPLLTSTSNLLYVCVCIYIQMSL